MLPKSRFSKPIFGHSAGSTKLDRPLFQTVLNKTKLLSPDSFRWGRGLPHEGVGAKKFDMSLATREIKRFLAGYPGILLGYPGGARKV